MVDSLHGDIGHNLLHHLIVVIERRDWFIVEEVLLILVNKLRVIALVLIAVNFVELACIVLHIALVFSGSDTKLSSTQYLAIYSCKRLLDGLAFLGHCHNTYCILSLGENEVVVFHLTAHIGTSGILLQLCETSVNSSDGSILDIINEKILHIALNLVGDWVGLYEHLNEIDSLLLVLVNYNDWLSVVGHCLGNNRCGVLWHLDRAEHILNLLLYIINVDITYNDDSLIVRTIPLLIVVAQLLILEIVNHRHQTDGVSHSILTSRIDSRQIALKHT